MSFKSIESRLLRAALAYPEAREEFPWGERVVKVRGRIFVFLGIWKKSLHVTTKLPQSRDAALGLGFTSPTAYNLGKSGWVSSRFEPGAEVPEALLLEWMDESYRAIAPKTLVKQLDAPPASDAPATRAPARRAPAKRTPGKKVAPKKAARRSR